MLIHKMEQVGFRDMKKFERFVVAYSTYFLLLLLLFFIVVDFVIH